VAVPPVTAAVPRTFVPSRNWTLPVAVEGESVAVRATDWRVVAGFGEGARLTCVAALLTVSAEAVELEAR
jgi:hypothetical protein